MKKMKMAQAAVDHFNISDEDKTVTKARTLVEEFTWLASKKKSKRSTTGASTDRLEDRFAAELASLILCSLFAHEANATMAVSPAPAAAPDGTASDKSPR